MDLCREIGAEPYVAVNTGLGGSEGAAALVQYANAATSTPMGRLRAENGHPLPFAIKWWAVGNEMWGDFQLGHMPLAEYLKKHIKVVDAMRAVDPSIRPVAVGAVGDWSRQMLTTCSKHMTLISEHTYWQGKADLVAHVQQTVNGLRAIADAHRTYRREIPALKGRDIGIALDEWNFWYGPNEYGELGTRYFLDDALGIAAALHEMARNSDLFTMANYAQTVNVIGAIKTTTTRAEMEPTGLVLALYRRHFGTLPLTVRGAVSPLDVAAARSEDGSILTLAVVNPTNEPYALSLDLIGARAAGTGQRFVLTGPERKSGNAPGAPRGVDVRQESLTDVGSSLDVAPHGGTLYSLALR
jgi:alpha-N-arabinofuranosidase